MSRRGASIVPGYQVNDKLYESHNSQVYRARREVDDCPVVLKVLQGAYPPPERVAWFKREYQITRDIDLPGVIDVYGLETAQNHWFMVLEDFGGDSLALLGIAGKLNVADFLTLAIQLTDVLGQIHQRRIIHKDVNPTNILLNPSSGQVKVIDFGISTVLSQESPTFRNPNALEATLAYISPEQTGRMNRAVDYRTDLYSLGVTLYELLTGRLPYETPDPLELVHAHMARNPAPPHAIRADVPGVVSDIILKLMAKNAEDRYQSAYGLKTDLEFCLANLTDSEALSAFDLGQHDVSGRLQMPQKLYGRAQEIHTLLQAFKRVSTGGQIELMLVAGYAGVGKTSLVNEIHKPITARRGYFISGKHEQFQRNIPFSAFTQALNEFCRHILTEGPEQLASWQDRISRAVGSNGQVLIDVIPDLELVIGEQAPVAQVGPQESQNRFMMVFQDFVKAISQADHPLVLFVDDLQWVDIASLNLLKGLMIDAENQYLLVIGAYRDNQVDRTHPLIATVEAIEKAGAIVNTLHLGNLSRHDVNALLIDTLASQPDRVQPLTDLVFEKTQGNAFFATEFIKALYEEGLLAFTPSQEGNQGRWQWDVAKIAAKEMTDNVIELMAGRIERLPLPTGQILQLAACIGSQFDVQVLSTISQQAPHDVLQVLWPAMEEAIVTPLDAQYNFLDTNPEMLARFRFQHDRIQQAAYSLIPAGEGKPVHLKIGRLLLAGTRDQDLEEKIFDIVNQLNQGVELITEPASRSQLVDLNLVAGRKAKSATAYEAAVHHLRIGLALLGPDSWTTQYETTYQLYLELAECEYLNSDFAEAERLLNILFDHARTKVERANVYEIKLGLHVIKGEIAAGVSAALECLELFDIHLPADPSREQAEEAYEQVWAALSATGLQIEDLLDLPVMTDASMQAVMKVLEACALPAHFATEFLMYLILARMVTISIAYGNTDESVVGYTIFAVTLCSRGFDRYQEGYRFGQLGHDLMEKRGASRLRGQIHMILNNVIPYTEHFVNCREYLLTGIQAGQEGGNLAYSSHSCANLVTNMLTVGDPLDEVWRESERGLEFVRRVQDFAAEKFIVAQQRLILNLQGLTANWSTFSDDRFDQDEFEAQIEAGQVPIVLYWYHIFKMIPRFIFGDYEQAAEAFERAREVMWVERWDPISTLFFYFGALTLVACYDGASSEKRDEYQEILTAYRHQIRLWAESCPENFANRYALVSAEMARIQGDDLEAMRLYEQAIQSALENGFVQNAGIGNELASRFYRDRGFVTIANVYLQEAWYCYQQWGAAGKVRQLEQTYSHLRERAESLAIGLTAAMVSPTVSPGAWGLDLDVSTLMKASQAISGEIVLDRLLSTLMQIVLENAGAERGCLILERNGQLAIEAVGTVGEGELAVRQGLLLEACDQLLSTAMVRYVVKTQESVVLHDAANEGLFTQDPYVVARQPKSVLCMPLIHQGKVNGVLYLENNLSTGAFTAERLQILHLLSSQAAISIENARLYDILEHRVAERTHELRQANEQLQRANVSLAQLYEQTRRDAETKAMLLREVNHRVKNNLTGIIGLIDTERRYAAGEESTAVQAAMERLVQRIIGLAEVHDILSQSEWSPVSLSDLVRSIVSSTLNASPFDRRVLVDVTPSPVRVSPRQANNLALVVNELVTNTIKYTASEGGVAHIGVRIADEGDDAVLVEYRDDGPGYPEDVLRLERHSVGMYLVRNLVHHALGGSLTLSNDGGAVTTIRFRVEKGGAT